MGCARCGAPTKVFHASGRSAKFCALHTERKKSGSKRGERNCPHCGKPFRQQHGSQRYCSAVCKTAESQHDLAHLNRRHIQRAKKLGVSYENVNLADVFARDRWHCKICGQETPISLRGTTATNAPELDHIVPLAQGGAHTANNCQCACRECNAAKSHGLHIISNSVRQGRPAFKATGKLKRKVSIAAAAGMAHEEIAIALGVSRNTLEKHFQVELSIGASRRRVEIIEAMFTAATQGNVTAQKAFMAATPKLAPPPPENTIVPEGKKAQAAAAAVTAHENTEWHDLLKSPNEPLQ